MRQFISFPKSGRTWIRYALTSIDLAQYINFHHDGFEYNDGARPALDFDLEARASRYGAGDKRIIYLHRDPRDVILSLYFQVTGRFKDYFQYEGSISDFIRDPYFGAKNLAEFQRQWDLLCDRGLALRVSYEECHSDFKSVLINIIEHLQLSASAEQVEYAFQASRIQNMRMIEMSGSFSEPWLQLRNEFPKVRDGVIGKHKTILSIDDQKFLNGIF